jgi:hypothetical protein
MHKLLIQILWAYALSTTNLVNKLINPGVNSQSNYAPKRTPPKATTFLKLLTLNIT